MFNYFEYKQWWGQIKGEHLQGDTRAGNKKGDGMEREAHLKGRKRGDDQNRSTSNSNLLHEHVQVFKKKFVMTSILSQQSIGGGRLKMKERSIGSIGANYASLETNGEWNLGIFMPLTQHVS